jgi:hypothetical protein
MVKMSRRIAAAGKNKTIERRQLGVECIDSLFDPRDLSFADPQRFHLAVLPLRTAKVAAEVEKIVLDVAQDLANIDIVNVQ